MRVKQKIMLMDLIKPVVQHDQEKEYTDDNDEIDIYQAKLVSLRRAD